MAFGDMFKKKDDDFSDFNTADDKSAPAHLGLPADGDITDTSPKDMQGSDFAQSHAIDKLQSLSQDAEKYTQPSGNRPNMPGSDSSSIEKDLQLINAKLDSLKSFMDSINQRLMHIERIAENSDRREEEIKW